MVARLVGVGHNRGVVNEGRFLRTGKSKEGRGRGWAVAPQIERLEGRRLLAATGNISGHIWWDANGNGLQDPGESPRQGGLVYLDQNNNGTFENTVDRSVPVNLNGEYVFDEVGAGTYTVRHLIPTDSVLSYPGAASQFDIEINFDNDIPEEIRAGVQQAAERWMKIVVGDLPDQGEIDDLQIEVVSGELPDTVLATGGPDQFRTGSNLPYHGRITWSQADLADSTDRAYQIAVHEIAHVLGFGTMWEGLKLREVQLGAPVYTGQAALAMYKFAVDGAARSIPIEPDSGDATAGEHWASSWAGANNSYDVMVAKLEPDLGARFISAVTVAAIADLGYQVNFSQADLDWPSTKEKYHALRQDPPLGADSRSYVVTLEAGQSENGLDFGIRQASAKFPAGPKPAIVGTLSGIAFIDANHNGRKDRNEKFLACTIFFDFDKDGVLDSDEPRIRIKTGAYKFTSIPLGTFRLKVLLPRGIKLAVPVKTLKMTSATLKQKMNLIGIRA